MCTQGSLIKSYSRCCAESAMGTFFVRPVVEACVSNTPNFGLITSVGDVTRSRTPGGKYL